MEKIKFPPTKMFGNLDAVFLEKRRVALDYYFSQVLQLQNVADFDKHLGSSDIQTLIEYDAHLSELQSSEPASKDGAAEQKAAEKKNRSRGSRSRRASRQQSTRRRRSHARRSRKGVSPSRNPDSSGNDTAAMSQPSQNAEGLASATAPPAPPSSETKAEAPATLPPEYNRFVKMQKAGVPEGALRQKMIVEGLDPNVLLGSGVPPPTHPVGGRGAPPRISGPGARPPAARPPRPPRPPRPLRPRPSGGAPPRGDLLASIRRGKMLKKTETREPASPAAPSAPPAGGMMAQILARRQRVE